MTLKRAKQITGLEIKNTGPNAWTAFDGPMAVTEAKHSKPSVALSMLVEKLYRLRGLAAMIENGFRCSRCGCIAPLQRHHKIHRSHGRKDSLENLEPLCAACHGKEH